MSAYEWREKPIHSFDEWITYVFDHPVTKPEWHWDLEAESWAEDNHVAESLYYLTELFTSAGTVLLPYSDDQVSQGLWYLASNACSNYMFAITDASQPWLNRQQCIRSMLNLFTECFAVRCSDHLYKEGDKYLASAAIDTICYMWFDIIPICGRPGIAEHRTIDSEFLALIEQIGDIPNLMCQESAARGLWHWSLYYQTEVSEICKRFVAKHPNTPAELLDYLEQGARAGTGARN